MDGLLMRKINGKLFLGLLIGGVVLTAGVFVVHYFQYQRVARALLWQARHAEKEGQVKRMARYLARYLEFNPRDNTEKAHLAKAWTSDTFAGNRRSRSGAVRLLDEVLISEDDPDLRRLLIKTALELRDLKLARDHLTKLLPPQDLKNVIELDKIYDPDNVYHTDKDKKKPAMTAEASEKLVKVDPVRGELESYWGLILEEDKQQPEALASYRLAVRHAPEHLKSYVQLSYLLRHFNETNPSQRTNNLTEADHTIDKLVTRNQSTAEAYLARWRYRRDFDLLAIRETGPRGKKDAPGRLPPKLHEAAQDIVEALKRKGDSVDVLLAAADLERLLGRTAAEDPLLDAEKRRAGLEEHRAKAFEYINRGLAQVKRSRESGGANGEFQLLWHKGNLLLDDLEFQRVRANEDGKPVPDLTSIKDEVGELITQVRKSQVPAAADYMKGRLLVHDREWADAASLFERARALMQSQPDLARQADLYLGECYKRLEEHTQMYNAFKRVAEWDPNSAAAQIGMAVARWAQGNRDDASKQYQAVASQGRMPPRAWIDFARLEIQRQVVVKVRDWRNAEQALGFAAKFNPKATLEIALLRVEILMAKGQPDQARALLEEEKKKDPKEADLWTALADLALRENKLQDARKLLDLAYSKLGDKVSLRLAEARFHLANLKSNLDGKASPETVKTAKAKLAALAENRDNYSEDDKARLLSGLADAQLRADNPGEARKLWQALSALPKHKNDLRLKLLLFDLAMKDGNESEMKKTLDDIRGAEQSNGVHQRYGQALMLIRQAEKPSTDEKDKRDKLRQAQRELDGVLAERPSWAPVYRARADIARLNGNREQRVQNLLDAVNNGDKSHAVLKDLVPLLIDRGDITKAQILMDEAQREASTDTALDGLEVRLAVAEGRLHDALKLAEKVVRTSTTNARDLLLIADLLYKTNQKEKALEKINISIKNAGDDPTPWVVKVQFLVANDNKKEAQKTIEEAREKLPEKYKELGLGLCYDAVRRPEEALKCYKKALADKPDDFKTVRAIALAHLGTGRIAEAEILLRRIMSEKLEGSDSDQVAWAKRTLAPILASGTDYRRFTEALELVGLKLDSNGRLPREEIRDENTDNRRAMARVLASQQGQRQFRNRAIELFEELGRAKALMPDDKFILALLLDAEGQTAVSWNNLEELVQPATRTPQYLAQYAMSRIVQRKGPADLVKAKQLIDWLEEMEKTRKVEPNTFASVELKARWHEARGEGDAAIAILEQQAFRKGAKPEEVLLVLASMSRQKMYRKAFRLCEGTWEKGVCPPEVVGGVSVALCRVMKPTDDQVATVEKHLLTAIDKKPKSMALKLHLADLYDKRGEYEKSAQQYREVLKIEKNNVVALNNLAWLLAIRPGGNKEKALAYINQAVNGMGRRADLLDTRGLVYLSLKDPSKALADLKEATTEAPTPTRLFHLAQAYHKDSNTSKARETLKQAKDKGLKEDSVHPVEQAACRRLLTEYSLR